MNKNKIVIALIITVILVVIGITYFFSKDNQYEQLSLNEIVVSKDDSEYILNKETEIEKIKVHIVGEVNNPGLIELDVGSRIYDAIELAGGLKPEADTSKTNLAYILSDGEKIYIPNINDEESFQFNLQASNIKVNINVATVSELTTIPGVGESTANSIIAYRNENRKI